MANIDRHRCTWSGAGVVGPGVSTFYCLPTESASFSAALSNFWDACKNAFPLSVSVTIPATGETIDDVTGTLVGTWSGGANDVVTGTNNGAFAAGAGARIVWATDGISNGRRVRGSTFMVPIASVGYDTTGTIDAAYVTVFQNAADALVGAINTTMLIWSRGDGTNGDSHEVLSALCPDKVSTLRSRRT